MSEPAKKTDSRDASAFITTGKSYQKTQSSPNLTVRVRTEFLGVLDMATDRYLFLNRSKTEPGYMFTAQTVGVDLNDPQADKVVGGLMDAIHAQWPHEVSFFMMQFPSYIFVVPVSDHHQDLLARLYAHGTARLDDYLKSQQVEYLMYRELPESWGMTYYSNF